MDYHDRNYSSDYIDRNNRRRNRLSRSPSFRTDSKPVSLLSLKFDDTQIEKEDSTRSKKYNNNFNESDFDGKQLDFRNWKFSDSQKQKHSFLNFFDIYTENYLAKSVIRIENAPRNVSLEDLQAFFNVIISNASHNVCRLKNGDLLINFDSEEIAQKVSFYLKNFLIKY